MCASPPHYNSNVCFVLHSVVFWFFGLFWFCFESNKSDLPFLALGSDLENHSPPVILTSILHPKQQPADQVPAMYNAERPCGIAISNMQENNGKEKYYHFY